MNSPVSDLSLYQSLEGSDLSPITVSSATLKGVVKTLLDFLIERSIEATVWFKLPLSPAWNAEIERYLQRGRARRVYLCTTREDKTGARSNDSPAVIPVTLEANSYWKRECFTLVLSEEFSGLLVARLQAAPARGETRWQLFYVFDIPVIERVLERIERSIAITDTTPEEILALRCRTATPNPGISPEALQQLLFKQIRQTERVQERVTGEAGAIEAIETLTESLAHSREVLQNFAQELRLPLTNMKTALRLLDSMQSKRELRRRYLELLHKECDRQSLLLTGLQEFIQFTQNVPRPHDSPIKLEDLIPGIVSTYQPLAEERGILLGYTIPAGFPAVACPESWLRHILLNLLNNSLKFTPSEGRVQVQAVLRQDGVEITVSDTGIGIDPEDLPRVFQSFYKGRNPSGRVGSSAGLGLTLVKYLVTHCGGSIEVNSKVGKGTTFKLTLPIVPTEG